MSVQSSGLRHHRRNLASYDGEEAVKLTMFIRSQVKASSKTEGEDWFETVLNIHASLLLPITPIYLFAPF